MVDWVGGAFSLFLSLPVVASHAWSLSHLYVSLPSDTGERKPHTLSHSLPYSVFIQSFHEYFLSAKSMPNSVLGNEYAVNNKPHCYPRRIRTLIGQKDI